MMTIMYLFDTQSGITLALRKTFGGIAFSVRQKRLGRLVGGTYRYRASIL